MTDREDRVIQKEIQGMIGIGSSFVLRNIFKRKLEMYSEAV